MVAVRSRPVVLSATLNVTEPLPVPLAPLVTVIQDAFATAVHVQPAGVVTAIVGPVAATLVGNVWLAGLIETEHPVV